MTDFRFEQINRRLDVLETEIRMVKLNDPITKTSIDEIAQDLISAAHRIYKYNITVALGQEAPEGFEKGNKDYQNSILAVVKPLLEKYEETKNIEANSSSAVISLLAKGKIKPGEAIALLKMLKTKIEVEETEIEWGLKKELMTEIDEEEEDINGKNKLEE